MSRSADHSPAPFDLRDSPQGYLIVDAFGDSVAALAYRTGDHPPAEQAANACLFKAAPLLLAAAKLGRAALAEDRRLTIEANCLIDSATMEPDPETLDEIAAPILAELDRQLAEVDAAIAVAEGRS